MTVAREKWNFVAYLFDVKFENIIIFLSQSSGFGLSMLRLSHDQESTTGFSFISSPFFLHRSHSITSKIWVQFPVFKPEFLEEHTKSWLWPTDILNHWYCSIIAGRKHVDYKVPLFLGWKRKINSWQKKRGQNWIIVTQHKMFRSSSFQERKIFSQL